MTKTDRWILAMAGALVLSAAVVSTDTFIRQCDRVRQETLRLHIVANSDTEQDQANKLLVRDALLAEYAPILSAGQNAQEAAALAQNLLDEITLTAKKTLQKAGDFSEVQVTLCTMPFETRTYEEGVTLPAGEYTALRVVIGAGSGHNWWCVMYPPLCIPVADASQQSEVEGHIRALSQTSAFQAKFALVEWIESRKG